MEYNVSNPLPKAALYTKRINVFYKYINEAHIHTCSYSLILKYPSFSKNINLVHNLHVPLSVICSCHPVCGEQTGFHLLFLVRGPAEWLTN